MRTREAINLLLLALFYFLALVMPNSQAKMASAEISWKSKVMEWFPGCLGRGDNCPCPHGLPVAPFPSVPEG